MAHDHHAVKMSKAQKKRSFQRHKRAQFDHIVDEKREAAAIRKELKKEARKEKMEKRRKGYEARDKDVQVAPAAGPDSLTATAPRPPLPQPQQQQMTTAPTAVITIATSTSQQGRSAPVARPGWIIAPVQVHMNEVDENEADKELAAHRAWVDLMCAPPPEAEEEEMPGEHFMPPEAGTASNWAIEVLDDLDDGLEMPF